MSYYLKVFSYQVSHSFEYLDFFLLLIAFKSFLMILSCSICTNKGPSSSNVGIINGRNILRYF